MSQTTDVRQLFSETAYREEFSLLVADFRPRQLEKISGCTNDATRRWIDGSRAPNGASLFNVAQQLPAVRDWVASRCGIERVMQAKSYDAWLAGLYAIAAGSGEDATKARWAINQLQEPREKREDNVVRDLFEARRRA